MIVSKPMLPTRRPDSDTQDCECFTQGTPGSGVLYFPQDGVAPTMVCIDRNDGWPYYRGASRHEAERAKAALTLSACQGDGHYMCHECIFFDGGDLARSGARAVHHERAPLSSWR